MSDNNERPQIVVNGSPATDQATAAIRNVLLVVSVATALTGIASKRDLAGFIVYVQSSEFITAFSIVVGAATFAWGQWKTRHRSVQLTNIALDPRVPDEVVAVKQS